MKTANEMYQFCLDNGYGQGFTAHNSVKHFGIIEKNQKTKSKRKTVAYSALKKVISGFELSVDTIGDDVLYIEKIKQGDLCRFEDDNTGKISLYDVKREPLEITYKQRLRRINESTSEKYELPLDEEVASILPYFIKSELVLSEDEGEANTSRAHFFDLLKTASLPVGAWSGMSVDSVYRMW